MTLSYQFLIQTCSFSLSSSTSGDDCDAQRTLSRPSRFTLQVSHPIPSLTHSHNLTNILKTFYNFDDSDNFLLFLQFLTILTILKHLIILTPFDNYNYIWQFWQFGQFGQFWLFGHHGDNPGDLRNLRHWLKFRQLRTWNHDNFCYLTIKSDTGQHSQFLRCFYITYNVQFYTQFAVLHTVHCSDLFFLLPINMSICVPWW